MTTRQVDDDPPESSRILLVDDEPRIRDFIGRALNVAGMRCDFAATGHEGLELTTMGDYDLVILDLVMPDMDGRRVLEQLMRIRPDQPVLVLSCLADVSSKVDCLDLGAQDYLTKPFSLAELLARVRARLRSDGHQSSEVLRLVSCARHRAAAGRRGAWHGLAHPAGVPVAPRADGARWPLGAEGAAAAFVWGYAFDPGSNVVDVCVRRLRRKLGFELITTVRGEGYRLAVG